MTGREIANPIASVLARARASLPAETGAVAEHRRRTVDGAGTVIVADVSHSMTTSVGPRRRIDVLREALDGALRALPTARLIAFSNLPEEINRDRPLPEPNGGTALHLALKAALALRSRRLLVISDGQPDSPATALEAVASYTGAIDTIYCGDDKDVAAIRFMGDLARRGRGEAVVRDLATGSGVLERDVRRLALPGR